MSGKKEYQYQIDDEGDNKEIEMQPNQNQNIEANEVFNEKSTSSITSSKKKKGAARLKAKKPVQSASDLEQKQKRDSLSEVQSVRQNQSAIMNFSGSQQAHNTVDISQMMNQFTLTTIKRDSHYQSLEKTVSNYHKGQEVQQSEQQLFRVKKSPKKTRGFFEMLTQTSYRYILIEKGILYTLRKLKNNLFIVSSSREFSQLFKIYEDKSKLSELRLCFYNKERDPAQAPIKKSYEFGNSQKCQEFLKQFDQILKLQGFSVLKN